MTRTVLTGQSLHGGWIQYTPRVFRTMYYQAVSGSQNTFGGTVVQVALERSAKKGALTKGRQTLASARAKMLLFRCFPGPRGTWRSPALSPCPLFLVNLVLWPPRTYLTTLASASNDLMWIPGSSSLWFVCQGRDSLSGSRVSLWARRKPISEFHVPIRLNQSYS